MIDKQQALEIIDKRDFFNDRDGRELWNDKPKEIQDEDIRNAHKEYEQLKEYVLNQPKVDEWISVEERLPEEHDSVFAELKGTDTWYPGMFEKMSDEVIVTCEYGDGTRVTKTSKTIDGEWLIETKSICKLKVLFWQPLLEPCDRCYQN